MSTETLAQSGSGGGTGDTHRGLRSSDGGGGDSEGWNQLERELRGGRAFTLRQLGGGSIFSVASGVAPNAYNYAMPTMAAPEQIGAAVMRGSRPSPN